MVGERNVTMPSRVRVNLSRTSSSDVYFHQLRYYIYIWTDIIPSMKVVCTDTSTHIHKNM